VVDDRVYGINLEGEVMASFDSPYNPAAPIAWDSDRNVLWICGTVTNDIIAFDREGNRMDDMDIDQEEYRIYGLAYFADDHDEAQLYIYHKDREGGRQTLDKYNFETGEKSFVTYLSPEEGGSPQGAFITNTYDVYSWVFMSVSNLAPNSGGDRVDIHQIEGRKDWFQLDVMVEDERIEALTGTLQTGEIAEYILTLNATDLPETTFVSELFYTHNADSGLAHINVELEVIGMEPPRAFNLASPANGDTLDTMAVDFTWEPSFDFNFFDTLTYEAWFAVDEDTFTIAVEDTMVAVVFDSLKYNLEWMYENATEWWVTVISGDDVVESAQHHSFFVRAPIDTLGLSDPLIGMPVEFSIAAIYPNPFNSSTTIRFGVDVNSLTALRVFDVMGREVDVLYSNTGDIGWKTVVWNADQLPSGNYIFRLESIGRVKIAKTALMR
jgi:hypothetical protein